MDDSISRQAAIDTLRGYLVGKRCPEDGPLTCRLIENEVISKLPPAQPVIVPCDYAKACNKVAMNRITSAVVYMEILEDFKEYGYVLVDMSENMPLDNNSEIPNSSDTISRAKAIEALDKRFDSIPMEQTSEILMLRKDLRNLPPAQSEHIIHCKDCKYFKQVFAPNENDGLCGHWHSKCDARTSRNGYCSYAER